MGGLTDESLDSAKLSELINLITEKRKALPNSENFSSQRIIIRPNPFNKEVSIEISTFTDKHSYFVVDAVGRIVKSGYLYTATNVIDMSELVLGAYTIVIANKSNENANHFKLIKVQ